MTGRAFTISMVTVGVMLAITAAYSFAPKERTLPAPVAARLVEHRVLNVIDSQRVKQLEAENARLSKQNRAIRDTAGMVAKAGLDAHRRADALQAAAIAAQTLADSALLWRQAHDERKTEADSAWRVVALDSAALARADTTAANSERKFDVEHARANRADDRIAELEPLAARADNCHVLGLPTRLVRCPSRKQAAVAGGVAGVLATIAAAVLVTR